MKQQDIFIWMMKTMQKGKLPAPYVPGSPTNLILVSEIMEELGIKDLNFLVTELVGMGFIKQAKPVHKILYVSRDGQYRASPHPKWDLDDCIELHLDMHQVTSLIDLRKRFGKVDCENWPIGWQEWQSPDLETPEDEHDA